MALQSTDSDFASPSLKDTNSNSDLNRPKDSSKIHARDAWIAIGLLMFFWVLYFESIPASFNTRYENRRFFDSDGEFITRQFFQGKTYTHNDHLLYHLLARGLYNLTATPPAHPYDSVPQHRWLSITAGAFGIATLFVFGKCLTRSTLGALAASVMIGGCAGWWFFSATIDTYLPHLGVSVAAFGFALLALKRQKMSDYFYLGICMGLAFLFRTDAFLLVFLAIVAFADGWIRSGWRLLACAISGATVGLLGYAILAHTFYGVPWNDVTSWAFSHTERPGIKKYEWGSMTNIQLNTMGLTLANQCVYTVILPDLETTRIPNVVAAFHNHFGILVLYAILILAAVIHLIWKRKWWLLAMILLWIFSRTVFYTWWDPNEPFLFACLSLPALWVLILDFVSSAKRRSDFVRIGLVVIVSALIWWNNYHTMILPFRQQSLAAEPDQLLR
jgi:hypothetical protein